MATLGAVKQGTYLINVFGEVLPSQIINSRDNKVSVCLGPIFAHKDYFIAGPDVNDNYFVSDACGIMIQEKGCCGH